MIGLAQISLAARFADAELEEHGNDLLVYWQRRDVDLSGLLHVAAQRGLRAAMILAGYDPRKLSRTEPTPVKLSPAARQQAEMFAAIYMDGFAAGFTLNPATEEGAYRGPE